MRFAPAALSAGLALAAGCGRPPPAVEIRLDGVPDLSQHDPALGDAARAENLCAPVAVSDSLAWLAGDTDRARQIALTMERLRWTPLLQGRRMIVVNVPEFMLRAYTVEDGRVDVQLEMKIIVGKALDTRTPLFDEIRANV